MRPKQWLCPVCGAVVADRDLTGPHTPVHEHYGHAVEFVPRAELQEA